MVEMTGYKRSAVDASLDRLGKLRFPRADVLL